MNDQEGFSFDKEMPSKKFVDDPTPPHTKARSGDLDTSKKAAGQVNIGKWERLVLNFISSFGSIGCISDECVQHFGPENYSTVTTRYKQLEDRGLIVRPPGLKRKSRKGAEQRVMIAAVYYKQD